MSEKGLLSKSIANNISEAIIDKLGGAGYAPTEWSKNINLLGIASADIEEALASITEDASSSDKGLLSLSIASDIGAILNKKYNTSRGFKPSEASSAVLALIPLPEKTTPSASIAHITDGADDVPIKSWEVEIAPTLTGKSAIEATQTGKNLLNNTLTTQTVNGTTFTVNADKSITVSNTPTQQTRVYISQDAITVNSAMFFSFGTMPTGTRVFCSRTSGGTTTYPAISPSHTATLDATYTNFLLEIGTTFDGTPFTLYPMCEVGSTATTYEPYTAPTVSTVNLGRTIYGGQVDIVNGVGTSLYAKLSLAVADMNNSETYPGWSNSGVRAIVGQGVNKSITDGTTTVGQWYSINTNGNNDIIFLPPARYNNMSQTDWKTQYPDLIIEILVEIPTPTDFTFTPITPTPETALGTNNFWADEGDSAVTYRADINLYEAPSMLLEANNTETEGNEEQEGNE